MSGGGFSAFSRRVTRGFSVPLAAATSPFRRTQQQQQNNNNTAAPATATSSAPRNDKQVDAPGAQEQRRASPQTGGGAGGGWWAFRRATEPELVPPPPPSPAPTSAPSSAPAAPPRLQQPAELPPPPPASSQASTTASRSQSTESFPAPKLRRPPTAIGPPSPHPPRQNNQFLWAVTWGAYCRRTPTRENQDAWFCLRPAPYEPLRYPLQPEEGEAAGDGAEKAQTVLWGAWQADNTLREPPKEGSVSACGAPVKIPFGFTTWVPDDSYATSVGPSISAARRPLVFGVLDGHGTGGRVASHVGSRTMASVLCASFESMLTKFGHALHGVSLRELLVGWEHQCGVGKAETKARLRLLYEHMDKAFREAQERILERNLKDNRDYGTTAVVAALAGRFVLTATAGDSSAFLIAATTKGRKVVVNVKLSCDHSLQSETELERIKKSGAGQVVVGDGGVSRLIPCNIPYELAKNQGLSINMARALGHCTLSRCALAPEPEMTLVDLMDIYSALLSALNAGTTSSNMQQLTSAIAEHRNFEAKAFNVTLQQKFGSVPDVALQDVAARIAAHANAEKPGYRTPRRNSALEGSMALRRSSSGAFEPASAPVQPCRRSTSTRRRSRMASAAASPTSTMSWTARLRDSVRHSWESPSPPHSPAAATAAASTAAPAALSKSPQTDGVHRNHHKRTTSDIQKPPMPPRPYVADDPFDALLESAQHLHGHVRMFLVLVSDGVTDVMQRSEVSDFVLRRHQAGAPPSVIAEALTKNAADIRAARGYRADNCTAVVASIDAA